MFRAAALYAFSLAAIASAQNVGTYQAETHPSITWQSCTASGTCTTNAGSVVLDANWRWLHSTTSSTNCYTGNTWDATLCPDPTTCTANCALDGADYSGTYGVTTSGNALTLKFVTQSSQTNVGSRLYLMASNTEYEMFKVLNQEFTFDVDVSQLPCGLNGALYFSEMDADGGMAKYPTNKAGAEYGTGYCDSQCPRDIKFINGQANMVNWTGTSANSGTGSYGTCCHEMDIWEANSISAAYTPHPCSVDGQTRCTGADCGGDYGRYAGVCDPDGCDFNSYRQGNTTFYGPGETVDTSSKFTVVTQFITNDNTTTGTLSEIRRFYVQNGKVIPNSYSTVTGTTADNSITDAYCTAQKTAFGDTNSFSANGGLASISKAFSAGFVLVLSIWDDYAVDMLWLDSTYPTNSTSLGAKRGTCSTTSGSPPVVESQSPNAQVIYSNIKVGPIGSTFSSGTTGTTGTSSASSSTSKTTATSTTTSSAPAATQTKYGQCGGQNYSGPTVCATGSTCTYSNTYFSQCV